MAFDCVLIDFGVSKTNKEKILNKFPYARVIPFIKSYKTILENTTADIRTEFFWLLTDLINYKNFNFDYIPEQFEKRQIHVWYSGEQKEGDTFLIPSKEFCLQIEGLKFLRDFKDINYHPTNTTEYKDWPTKKFTFNNLLGQVKKQKDRYTHYYFDKIYQFETPSFWDEEKMYITDKNKLNLTIPKFSFDIELYEHGSVYERKMQIDNTPVFDIVFIHNYEGDWQNNLELLKNHCKNLPNKLKVVAGVNGRNKAYKSAANLSSTEYFYAVFSKCKINKDFGFNFVPNTLKTIRHYIFNCFNPLLNYAYGHQAVILYNKQMVLDNEGTGLDFTLSQQHDHINILTNETTFHIDSKVCFRTTFREVIKLLYWKKNKPTVENNFILKKWLSCENETIKNACEKAVAYFKKNCEDYNKLFATYDWKFIDSIT